MEYEMVNHRRFKYTLGYPATDGDDVQLSHLLLNTDYTYSLIKKIHCTIIRMRIY